MDELKLMQDYFWILEQCHDPDTKFADHPVEKNFCSLWLSKLCNDIYPGTEAKRMRNLYLLELSECIDKVELSQTFMRVPPKGALPPLMGISHIKLDEKTIVHEMHSAAAEYIPLISPRNYHTHMSDPKQGPIWMQMGTKEPFNPNKSQNGKCGANCGNESCKVAEKDNSSSQRQPERVSGSSEDDDVNVNVSFGEFCLDAIAKELAGQAMPRDCPELEEQLEKYSNFIQKYPIGQEAKTLEGNKLRTFLLLNLQTDLVQALENNA